MPMLIGSGILRPVSSGTWTTVFTKSLATSDVSYVTFTLVNVYPRAELSVAGGTQLRLTLKGGVTEGFELSGLWVGNGGGGDVYDFTGDQVQLKQSGSNTIVAAADTEIVTDAVAFVKDDTNPLVVAAQFQNAAADNTYRTNTAGSGTCTVWAKVATEASTQNKSSYSDFTGILGINLVTKIELFI